MDDARVRKVDKSGIITTVAGNGGYGYSGDGGQAVKASLSSPAAIAFDVEGNLYVADIESHRIRKVDKSGVITTVVGNGGYGYSDDGGQAVKVSLASPADIAFDVEGNLYIAELDGASVRKVRRTGIITTAAGGVSKGSSGDGGQAVKAMLVRPVDIAFDTEGNLYIVDFYDHRIRKVDKSGIITTVAGSREGGYSGDGGRAVKANLSFPLGIAFDAEGDFYFVESGGNGCVRKVNKAGIITTVVTGDSRFER